MTKHICKYCNYETEFKNHYDRHKETQKHKNNISIHNKEINTNQITKNDINIIMQQNNDLKKEIEKLKNAHEKMEKNNNQNTQTIVKEARTLKKSILSILNTDFKDTPSIEYIDEEEFRIHLEEEYNLKLDDKDNRLFMRIFSDFEKRKLVHSMSKVILRFLKKENQKEQSVFNIDSSRGNYATKIQDIWHNDKKGLQLKKYTIDYMMKYMLNVMDIYRLKLVDMYNENKIKKNINVTDYIMEKQGMLLEVNSFLTNPNTHKKIILNMCSELRIEEKYLTLED
jgi:hypothetical protein